MITTKARIKLSDNYTPIVPIVVPDTDEVRAFATKLHADGRAWQGECFGWHAEYVPQKSTRPLDSKMSYTPADFCIGESDIWFYSLMWEHGQDSEPVEFLDDKNIIKKNEDLYGTNGNSHQ